VQQGKRGSAPRNDLPPPRRRRWSKPFAALGTVEQRSHFFARAPRPAAKPRYVRRHDSSKPRRKTTDARSEQHERRERSSDIRDDHHARGQYDRACSECRARERADNDALSESALAPFGQVDIQAYV
jgi:hypothetical protein